MSADEDHDRRAFVGSDSGKIQDDLSPDLPPKEALYLFIGFSSYMRAPLQGSEGLDGASAFKDAVRLLEHARNLALQPLSNVHILHLKYRFRGSSNGSSMAKSSQDANLSPGAQIPIPQPFSVLHDPVIKVDFDSGVFDPMPAQAISRHISKHCHPLPRIIVVSYVASNATETHICGLASWAASQQPPIYVFSPHETRIREMRPLCTALGSAIPLSMYGSVHPYPEVTALQSPRGKSEPNSSATSRQLGDSSIQRRKPPEKDAIRVPLWTLASGAGFLAGFTTKTWQIQISDFFACKILEQGATDSPAWLTDSLQASPWHSLVVRTPQARNLGKASSPSFRTNPSSSATITSSPLRSSLVNPRYRSVSSQMTKGWKKDSKERMEDTLDHSRGETLPEDGMTNLISQMEDALQLANGAVYCFDDETLSQAYRLRASGMLLDVLK